jgi:hypothetical protein
MTSTLGWSTYLGIASKETSDKNVEASHTVTFTIDGTSFCGLGIVKMAITN